jgi:hypothetical protein
MYNIDQNTESTLALFTPGIKENCILEDVRFEAADKEGKKDKVLRFVFKGPNGEKHIETIFPINKENTVKAAQSWGRNPAEVLKEESMALTGKINHIMSTYLPKEACYMSATNWEDFCKQVISKLGDTYKTVAIRIKLVLNTKDYLQLPKKAKAPFIQKMSETNSLTINPKWDKVVYSAKSSAVIEDPFAATNTGTAAAGDANTDPFAF